MPHYNKANNKHYNISTSKPLQGKFEYFCTPVFIHIHATELLQDCPLACTILHAQSQVLTVWNLTYLDLERERDLEREADLDLEWPRDFERLLRWLLLLLRLLRRLRDLQ